MRDTKLYWLVQCLLPEFVGGDDDDDDNKNETKKQQHQIHPTNHPQPKEKIYMRNQQKLKWNAGKTNPNNGGYDGVVGAVKKKYYIQTER